MESTARSSQPENRGLALPGGLQDRDRDRDRDGRFLLRLLLRDRATCDPAVSACFCFGRRSWSARK